MRPVEQLLRLQELDDQIAFQTARLQSCIARRTEADMALEARRRAVEKQERALRNEELHLRKAERVLQETEARLREAELRLYSAAVHSRREAQALETEVEQLRARKEQLEDDALSRLLALDEMREHLEILQQELQAALSEYRVSLDRLQAEESACAAERERLVSERAAQASTISPALLQLYEQIRAARGRAVARIEGTACANCRLEVALLTRKAALGEALVRCENCGCILFYEG